MPASCFSRDWASADSEFCDNESRYLSLALCHFLSYFAITYNRAGFGRATQFRPPDDGVVCFGNSGRLQLFDAPSTAMIEGLRPAGRRHRQ
jgi:hypothetical protein